MKIRFKEDCGFTLVDATGNEVDNFFKAGDIQEGDILADHGEYVSFGDRDGWQAHGLKKTQFEIVSDSTWPFPDQPEPQWYSEQKARWDELEKQGWKFSSVRKFGKVCLQMERNGAVAAFELPWGAMSFQTIHTWMLRRCEEVARAQ